MIRSAMNGLARLRALAGLALLLGALQPTFGAELGRSRPDVIAGWKERMRKADEKLRQGNSRGVRVAMDDLLFEMAGRLERGPSGPALLGQGLALRGLAYASDGKLDEAAWDWRAAQSFVPALAKVPLASYGDVGEKLAAALALEPTRPDEDASEPNPRIVPPVKKSSPSPVYPAAKANACLEAPIVVRAVVDPLGRPRSPEVVSFVDPVLEFSALEALRKWRFEPARLDGEPVAVVYDLTVHYRLEECRNLAARARLKEAGRAPSGTP